MVLRRTRGLLPGALALALAACASARAPSTPALPPLQLVDTAGGTTTLPADLERSRLTVFIFYADHCPCFRVHEGRLRALARDYGERGVRVVLVDSEVSATVERDARAVAERGLPAITIDRGARLADALGAGYATYSAVFDASGRLRYRGGVDSDKNVLHDDAHMFLRDALEDLLAEREPRVTEGKALGCALQTR